MFAINFLFFVSIHCLPFNGVLIQNRHYRMRPSNAMITLDILNPLISAAEVLLRNCYEYFVIVYFYSIDTTSHLLIMLAFELVITREGIISTNSHTLHCVV